MRIVVCLAGGCIAAISFRDGKSLWATMFVLAAVLFNPFVPIEMKKNDWLFFRMGYRRNFYRARHLRPR
jgi:hypothetical protein